MGEQEQVSDPLLRIVDSALEGKTLSWFQRYQNIYAECAAMYLHLYVGEQHATAKGYVWGREDSLGVSRGPEDSIDFGYAYGVHAAEFQLGRRRDEQNIRDAYARWVEGKPIGD